MNRDRLAPYQGSQPAPTEVPRDFKGTGQITSEVSVVGNSVDATKFEIIFPNFTERASFQCGLVAIPGLDGGETLQASAVNSGQLWLPGDNVIYQPLTCTFNLTRDLRAYEIFYTWIKAYSDPECLDQFLSFVSQPIVNPMGRKPDDYYALLMHDIILHLKDESTVLGKWHFKNCFPTSMDGFQLDAGDTETPSITFMVIFRYHYYIFTRSPHA